MIPPAAGRIDCNGVTVEARRSDSRLLPGVSAQDAGDLG